MFDKNEFDEVIKELDNLVAADEYDHNFGYDNEWEKQMLESEYGE